MHILYGFSNCTDKKYNEMMSGKNISILRPDQKYHGLLIKGLAANGADVKCFSGLPVNRGLTKKVFIREKDEIENSVYYHYYKTVNLPAFRQLSIFLKAFFSILKTKSIPDTYIICDCLNIANAYGMMLAAKLKKIPVVTIVTDIPDMMYTGFTKKIANNFFKSVDGFILLTDAMNERVNPKQKPNIVLEGHSDSSLPPPVISEKSEIKNGIKQIIYAGSVDKIYGIKNLVEGFILANIDDCELVVFGNGDYAEEVKKAEKQFPGIKYMGIRDNSEVVKAEQSASLLVNPRPTAPEYTKYSFPSKTMEYIASGTPVLTTRLPGIPDEYYPYIYLIEDETPMGISDTLRKIFSLSAEYRNNFGENAREFVLKYKSNVAQAKKIIKFLESEVKR